MQKINEAKAKVLYDYLDGQEFFTNPVEHRYRSTMNVTFTSPNPDLDKKFCAEAAEARFVNYEEPPPGGRHARFHLQRHASRGCGQAGGLHGEVPQGERITEGIQDMYTIKTLNAISPVGLAKLNKNLFDVAVDADAPDGILVRSADLLNTTFHDNLLAIARAGAGVNNIPLDRCSEQGIVVFNTPGANANAVAELVIGMLIAS